MTTTESYIVASGIDGYDRLKVLSRAMHEATSVALERVGLHAGMECLDVGCGSGDVSFEMARRVGRTGRVVAIDIDDVTLELARREAAASRGAVEFVRADATKLEGCAEYDLVYARFLLTHLREPALAVARFVRLLRPGGVLLVEDVDFGGSFCHPKSASHDRYVELYIEASKNKSGDPFVGLRMPEFFGASGLTQVWTHVVQPTGIAGEIKLLPALTVQAIARALVAQKLATAEEVERLSAELTAMAADPTTMLGLPRVIQTWGRRPG